MIEKLFLCLLTLDPGATIGPWDAASEVWRVNLNMPCVHSIYGVTIEEALERAIVALETRDLEATLFSRPKGGSSEAGANANTDL